MLGSVNDTPLFYDLLRLSKSSKPEFDYMILNESKSLFSSLILIINHFYEQTSLMKTSLFSSIDFLFYARLDQNPFEVKISQFLWVS